MVKAARKLLINYWANSLVKAGSESGSVIRNYSSCISSCFCNIFFFLRQESFLSSKLIYSCCFMLNWSQKTLRCTITVSWGDSYVVILSSSDKDQKFLSFEFEQNCFQTLFFLFFSQCSMRYQLFFCVAHEGTCQQLSIQKEQITERDSSYMNIYSFPLM